MPVTPRYWGSWKGLILKAIAINDARTWSEIRASTGLDTGKLNKTLSELLASNLLSKTGDTYWIEDYNLYKEYKVFGESEEFASHQNNSKSRTETKKNSEGEMGKDQGVYQRK